MTFENTNPEARKEGIMLRAGNYGFAPVFSLDGDAIMRVRLVEKVGSCWLVRTADLRSAGKELLVFADEIQPETVEETVVFHKDGLVGLGGAL